MLQQAIEVAAEAGETPAGIEVGEMLRGMIGNGVIEHQRRPCTIGTLQEPEWKPRDKTAPQLSNPRVIRSHILFEKFETPGVSSPRGRPIQASSGTSRHDRWFDQGVRSCGKSVQTRTKDGRPVPFSGNLTISSADPFAIDLRGMLEGASQILW